jgi:hypothetical protein
LCQSYFQYVWGKQQYAGWEDNNFGKFQLCSGVSGHSHGDIVSRVIADVDQFAI